MNLRIQELKNARLQLHQTAQLLAAAGISFLEKQADDSHTNLQWKSELQSFVRSGFGPQGKHKVALNIPELKYHLFENDDSLAEFTLNGKTEANAVDWFKEVLQEKGIDISLFTMKKINEFLTYVDILL